MEFSLPLERDPKFQICCYGYLGEHSAVQKLRDESPGTFLFRSSSTDNNAITISFVHRDGTVKHRRMYRVSHPASGYTFQLPGYKQGAPEVTVYYKNYFHLLQDNSDWMNNPLKSIQPNADNSQYFEKTKIDVHCKDKEGPPSSAEIHFVAQTLRTNMTVAVELCIRANVYYGFKISFDDMVALIQALEENTTVNTLTILHMHLNDVVCDALAKLLSVSRFLTKLHFHHCSCDAMATISIIKALSGSSLQTLTLNGKVWTQKNMRVSERDITNFQCLPWECAKQ